VELQGCKVTNWDALFQSMNSNPNILGLGLTGYSSATVDEVMEALAEHFPRLERFRMGSSSLIQPASPRIVPR
jgi:hypothetical protein